MERTNEKREETQTARERERLCSIKRPEPKRETEKKETFVRVIDHEQGLNTQFKVYELKKEVRVSV